MIWLNWIRRMDLCCWFFAEEFWFYYKIRGMLGCIACQFPNLLHDLFLFTSVFFLITKELQCWGGEYSDLILLWWEPSHMFILSQLLQTLNSPSDGQQCLIEFPICTRLRWVLSLQGGVTIWNNFFKEPKIWENVSWYLN